MSAAAFLQAVESVPWLDLIRTAAPVATAIIAYRALRNWQRQDRAKREAEFLDQVFEATHCYIIEMSRPIELLHFAKIGMASHVVTWDDGDQHEKEVAGAIAYIEKNGECAGKRLSEALSAVEPSVVKLRSLMAKGQMFGFLGYSKLQNAISMLTWHHGRIVSFCQIIESPSWNWANDQVRSLLEKVMIIDPGAIRTDLGTQSVAVIEFAREAYEHLYGPRIRHARNRNT